ncbi:hypothetical protein [Brevundimonas goettingensis]|uniref:Uncharacterized protein n=1 Tax=Brevundimonas goettingensis TaxID=2774190 RepID=A0A975BZM2_9CAUL|nr:hypothetical protein [Brevundimonas goettingensis]QTC90575.1 hypothetical protein IFJ75_15055 [Brevundimonas goettingensis]
MMFAVLAFAAALQTSPAQTGGQVEAATTVQTPGVEAPAGTASAAAPTPAEPARERLICTNEQVTGTRFPIRRCRTAAQIAADRVESQEMLRRQQGSRTPPAG